MSKTKISDLRREIVTLQEEGARLRSVLVTVQQHRAIEGEQIRRGIDVTRAQSETIAALRELIEMYKLRCNVKPSRGITVETDTGVDQVRTVGGRFFSDGVGESEPHPDERHMRYSVRLLSHGLNKIKVIKAIRVIVPGILLKAAKDLSEKEGAIVASGSNFTCQEVAAMLTNVGAVVEVVKSVAGQACRDGKGRSHRRSHGAQRRADPSGEGGGPSAHCPNQ
jgi:ribosomal protein L7/L12